MKAQKPLLLVFALLSLFVFSCSKKNDSESNPYPPINISGFTPAAGSEGGLITVKGSNFTSQISSTHLLINGVQAEISNVSDTEIIAYIPANCGTGKVAVRANGLEGFSTADFEYLYGTWTRKADFPGRERSGAVGFTIGNKAYLLSGLSDELNGIWNDKDLWEYDPSNNQWTKRADFPGNGRDFAVGFAIGNKGYIGTGWQMVGGQLNDFWEYDPALDSWTQKANFPGHERAYAVALTIGNNAYVGSGIDGGYTPYKDFWKYDQLSDAWTRVADFPGDAIFGQSSFTVNGKGYIGLGATTALLFKEFWQYDPETNIWVRKTDFPGEARAEAVGFAVGNKGYMGFGGSTADFWEYEPATDKWTQRANWKGYTTLRAATFTIGEKAYIATGSGNLSGKEVWEFSPQ